MLKIYLATRTDYMRFNPIENQIHFHNHKREIKIYLNIIFYFIYNTNKEEIDRVNYFIATVHLDFVKNILFLYNTIYSLNLNQWIITNISAKYPNGQ